MTGLLLRTLLTIALQDTTAALDGKVTDTEGGAVDGAEVRLVGTDRTAMTTAEGTFALRGIAAGEYVVEVRRIGFKAVRVGAVLEAKKTKHVRIILERGVYELPEVATTVRQLKPIEYAWTTRYDDFFRRRHVGLGAFLTRDQLERKGGGRTPSLLAGVRGIRLVYRHLGVSGTDVEVIGCERVSVWIDGQKQRYADVPGSLRLTNASSPNKQKALSRMITASHLERVSPSQIELIEVYRGPAEMPAEFLDDSCAAIAIWTR